MYGVYLVFHSGKFVKFMKSPHLDIFCSWLVGAKVGHGRQKLSLLVLP